MNLLTAEQLIEIKNLKEEDYKGIDLDKFIEDYDLTEENVNDLNVVKLLQGFERMISVKNVTDVLSIAQDDRKDDFTSDATCLAFCFNGGTITESAYYDFENDVMYADSDYFIFNDLTKYESKEISDENLLEKLYEAGIFGWVSSSAEFEGDDGQSFVIVVKYNDNTEFRVSYSGIVSECAPANYKEVINLIMGY